jgi:GNAT superfamily N-acetyltransferase
VAARAGERGWSCWLALEGDEAVSAGGLFVAEGAGYLGFAGTLEEHRGKGAQGALLAARAERAAELGCDLLLTETGEQVPERPSNSYRNLLRAGFAEVEVTANWLGRS